jgi:glycosyltransferase involved in cell wall biosynthesis
VRQRRVLLWLPDLHGCPGGDRVDDRNHGDHGDCGHRIAVLSAVRPDISVLVPARNEGSRLAPTIEAIAGARTTDACVEFVIVDDASSDGTVENLVSTVPRLLAHPRIDIRVCRVLEHEGIYAARNRAASIATADLLFMTDAHVRFSRGWDEYVTRHAAENRILVGTTADEGSGFRGYGCGLLVPSMGTAWNTVSIDGLTPVQLAPCATTLIPRRLFHRLGGYDPGMLVYGAGEPEFSVRAWLHGAEIYAAPGVEVHHRFKPREEFARFVSSVHVLWLHNCLRFALLYMSPAGCLQVLRHFARSSEHFPRAAELVSRSDVWQRRRRLEGVRVRPFEWFVERFGLRNEAGGLIV